jgi:hypothetical protein
MLPNIRKGIIVNNNMSHDESEDPSPGQSTCKDRIDALLARIEDHITLLHDGIRIDELSANEIEQSLSKYYGMSVRLLTLRVKVEADEPKSYIESSIPMYSSIGEPKLNISTAADSPESYDDEDDDEN